MAYGIVTDVPGPIELYDALHAEFANHPSSALLLHVSRPTTDGFQIIEVWRSKEEFERWAEEHVGPAMGAVAAAGWTIPEVTTTVFEPRGLVVPAAGVFV